MKNKRLIVAFSILIIVLGLMLYLFYSKSKKIISVNNPAITADSSVLYSNADYGFSFSLPPGWKGYSIVKNTWEGNSLTTSSIKETGPKIIIRNPNWTTALHYEDIPIMIFTLKQWDSYLAEDFSVGAAPIRASELARNNAYVLALPARWDFDYSKGFEEAGNILKSNPIKVFDVKVASN